MFRAPICERDWRPSCIVRRSSSSSVDSGARTAHCDTHDSRRLVATKTAFARWRNPGELRGSLQHADEITKLYPISKIWLAKWLPANMAGPSSIKCACRQVLSVSQLGCRPMSRRSYQSVSSRLSPVKIGPNRPSQSASRETTAQALGHISQSGATIHMRAAPSGRRKTERRRRVVPAVSLSSDTIENPNSRIPVETLIPPLY